MVLQAYAQGQERLESLIVKLSNDRAPRLPNGRVSLSLSQRPASPGTSNMTQVCMSPSSQALRREHCIGIAHQSWLLVSLIDVWRITELWWTCVLHGPCLKTEREQQPL